MKALTLIQPWATAILLHGKNIENRPWAPPRALIGKRFAIHAGKKFDRDAVRDLRLELDIELPRELCVLGAILGSVELAGYLAMDGCHALADFEDDERARCGLTSLQIADALNSEWRAEGSPFLWVLREPRVLSEPIPWPGALGLWNVPDHVARRLEEQKAVANG